VARHLALAGAHGGTGTVAIDGLPGQVLFGGNRLFVKAGAAYWTRAGATKAAAAQFDRRWMDNGYPEDDTGEPLLFGVSLESFAPTRLGPDLRRQGVGNCGAGDGEQTPLPDWSAASTSKSAARPPAGVPADAVRFAGPPESSCAPGTYWAGADAPHQLLAYSGAGQPVTAEPDDSTLTATALTVRAGTAAQAGGVYQQISAAFAALPTTVPVTLETSAQETASVDFPAVCYGADCDRIDLDVVGGNNGKVLTLSMGITVSVTSEGRKAGQCHTVVSDLAPGSQKHVGCTVTDPRVAKIQAGQTSVVWSDTYELELLRLTEKIDPAALAAHFGRAPAASASAASTSPSP
jgi:hypothetical protein